MVRAWIQVSDACSASEFLRKILILKKKNHIMPIHAACVTCDSLTIQIVCSANSMRPDDMTVVGRFLSRRRPAA